MNFHNLLQEEALQIHDVTQANGWKHAVSPIVENFEPALVSQAKSLLASWRGLFPIEDTWVGRNYKVASLFVRLDCVRLPTGELGLYEIEERPCGLGVSMLISPQFQAEFTALARKWPPFVSVRDPRRNTDDALFMEEISLEEALARREGNLLVRSRPEDEAYHPLAERAISSVRHEGEKQYGLVMGLWDKVHAEQNPDYIPGDPRCHEEPGIIIPAIKVPSVLKPTQGTRCRDVLVYFPSGLQKPKIRGRSELATVGQVVRKVLERKEMCRQTFIAPMQLSHQPALNAIYRIYFGFDPDTNDFEPLGGVWAAAPYLRVHGTDKTVFGPLVVQN